MRGKLTLVTLAAALAIVRPRVAWLVGLAVGMWLARWSVRGGHRAAAEPRSLGGSGRGVAGNVWSFWRATGWSRESSSAGAVGWSSC